MSFTESIKEYVKNEKFGLSVTVVTFIFIFAYMSNLRYLNFFTANWDLGIIEQTLWTGSHGYLLFETGDFVRGGARSFLQIHSTYIALIFAYIFYLSPSPLTLFIIQAAAISSSMVPLYLLSKNLGLPRYLTHACILAYILNFSLVAGVLFDFHWEAFIPIEFLSMFYLMTRRRFLLALIPFLLGCATLEVFPFLGFGAAMYFAVDRYSVSFFSIRKRLYDREWQFIVALLVLSVVSFVIIRTLQLDLIPRLVGTAPKIGAVGSNLESLFSFGVSKSSLIHSLLYWGLLYVSFLFIPFLHPKHLLLALPWLIATIFIYPYFSSSFGNQYALIAILPVTVGFVHGVGNIERKNKIAPMRPLLFTLLGIAFLITIFASVGGGSRLLLAQSTRGEYEAGPILILVSMVAFFTVSLLNLRIDAHSQTQAPAKSGGNGLRRIADVSVVLLILLILVFSVMMSPLNHENYMATPQPGYTFSLSGNPEFKSAVTMADYIPNGAAVLSTNNLFPLVANNPNSYSLPWYRFSETTWPYFPYNSTNLPEYVFANSFAFVNMPQFLMNILFNQSYYGVRAFSFYNSYPGSIYLFQLHYNGATSVFEVSQPNSMYFFSAENLTIGSSGRVVKDGSSLFGYTIASSPAVNLSANGHAIWYGPYVTFIPGRYQVTLSLKGGQYHGQAGKGVPILQVNSNAFGTGYYYYSTTIYSNQLSNTSWTKFNYNFSIAEPFPNTEFRGYIAYHNDTAYGFVYLNYIEVKYLGPIS